MHIPKGVFRGSGWSRMVKVELRAAETKGEGCFYCLASQVHIEVSVAQTVAESISTRSIEKSDMASHKCLFRGMCTTKAAMTTQR